MGRSPRDLLVWNELDEEEELDEIVLVASKELVDVISLCWQVQLDEQLVVHTAVCWVGLWGGPGSRDGSFRFRRLTRQRTKARRKTSRKTKRTPTEEPRMSPDRDVEEAVVTGGGRAVMSRVRLDSCL